VQTKRPAPSGRQEPVQGHVPFRTDAIEHNSIGERECVIEALRAATGERYSRKSLGLDLKGDLNFRHVVHTLGRVNTPFRLQKSKPVSWSDLLAKPPGIYIGRAMLKDGEAHYMVYDAWRHLVFVGGDPPPPDDDPTDQYLFFSPDSDEGPPPLIDANDELIFPKPEPSCAGRSWFVEEHELQEPSKFQEYMMQTLNVRGGIDNLYSVNIIAKRARDTHYNTPEQYD